MNKQQQMTAEQLIATVAEPPTLAELTAAMAAMAGALKGMDRSCFAVPGSPRDEVEVAVGRVAKAISYHVVTCAIAHGIPSNG